MAAYSFVLVIMLQLFTFSFGGISNGEKHCKLEGSNLSGVCRLAEKCPTAYRDYKNGIKPTYCSPGFFITVCCVTQEVRDNARRLNAERIIDSINTFSTINNDSMNNAVNSNNNDIWIDPNAIVTSEIKNWVNSKTMNNSIDSNSVITSDIDTGINYNTNNNSRFDPNSVITSDINTEINSKAIITPNIKTRINYNTKVNSIKHNSRINYNYNNNSWANDNSKIDSLIKSAINFAINYKANSTVTSTTTPTTDVFKSYYERMHEKILEMIQEEKNMKLIYRSKHIGQKKMIPNRKNSMYAQNQMNSSKWY